MDEPLLPLPSVGLEVPRCENRDCKLGVAGEGSDEEEEEEGLPEPVVVWRIPMFSALSRSTLIDRSADKSASSPAPPPATLPVHQRQLTSASIGVWDPAHPARYGLLPPDLQTQAEAQASGEASVGGIQSWLSTGFAPKACSKSCKAATAVACLVCVLFSLAAIVDLKYYLASEVEASVRFTAVLPRLNYTQLKDRTYRSRFEQHFTRQVLRRARAPGASVVIESIHSLRLQEALRLGANASGVSVVTCLYFPRKGELRGVPGAIMARGFAEELADGNRSPLVNVGFEDTYGEVEVDPSSIVVSIPPPSNAADGSPGSWPTPTPTPGERCGSSAACGGGSSVAALIHRSLTLFGFMASQQSTAGPVPKPAFAFAPSSVSHLSALNALSCQWLQTSRRPDEISPMR